MRDLATERTGIGVTGGTPAGRDEMLRNAIARAKEGDTGALHYIYVRYADDFLLGFAGRWPSAGG